LLLGAMLFLGIGSTLAVDSFTPQRILWLISAIYLVSAIFAAWVAVSEHLHVVASVQITWDVLVTTALVYLSAPATTARTLLYGPLVLMPAITIGPRASHIAAFFSAMLYLGVSAAVSTGKLAHPPDQDASLYLLSSSELGLALLRNIVGLTIVSLLAGHLSSR